MQIFFPLLKKKDLVIPDNNTVIPFIHFFSKATAQWMLRFKQSPNRLHQLVICCQSIMWAAKSQLKQTTLRQIFEYKHNIRKYPNHHRTTLKQSPILFVIYNCLSWIYIAGYWQELQHAVIYADPEHPKHAQWVTCLVSMLAIQELGCFQLPGIVYRSLQHAATWGVGCGWMAQQ